MRHREPRRSRTLSDVRRSLWVVAAVVLQLALPQSIHGQQQGRLQPGERVRVVAPAAGVSDPIAGTVVELRRDTLTMQLGSRTRPTAVQVSIPVTAVTRLERSAGARNRVANGVLGVVAGTGLGAVAGQLHYRMQSYQVTEVGEEREGRESLRTELTVAGAVIGTVVGVLLPGERWRRVPVLGSLTAGGSGGTGTRLGFRIAM